MSRWALYGIAAPHAPLASGRWATVVDASPRTIVGTVLFHGISDRDTAAEQLDTQIKAIARAVVTAAGGDPALITTTHEETMEKLARTPHWKEVVTTSRDAIDRSPYRSLWDDAVSPLFDEWVKFYEDKRHWYDAITEEFTSWEDYKAWFDRVEDLRKKVQDAGIGAQLAPLHPLHKSAQEAAEEAASDIWKILKYAIYGVLGLVGLIAVVMIGRYAHGGRSALTS